MEFAYRYNLERLAQQLIADPTAAALDRLNVATEVLQLLPFEIDLWQIQNNFYRLLNEVYPKERRRAAIGHDSAQSWCELLEALGKKLSIKIDATTSAPQP